VADRRGLAWLIGPARADLKVTVSAV